MLKERKTQDEDPTSHLPEEESTSSPAERVVDEPNPKKRRGNDSHATFVLMHNTALLVNYHLSCTLTPWKTICISPLQKFFENKRKLQKLIQNSLSDHWTGKSFQKK